MNELIPMVCGYLTAALWSSADEDGEPLDAVFGIDDFAPEAIQQACDECRAFADANERDRDSYIVRTLDGAMSSTSTAAAAEAFGHDLWLTRNGHGAEFWDRGLGALGYRLTMAANAEGSRDCYVGDDGQIHFL